MKNKNIFFNIKNMHRKIIIITKLISKRLSVLQWVLIIIIFFVLFEHRYFKKYM